MILPELDSLHPWITPELAREAAYQDWLESAVVHGLIAYFSDQISASVPLEELERERARLEEAYHFQGAAHRAAWCELRGLDENKLQAYLGRSWRWRQWVKAQFEPQLESLYLLRQQAYTSYLISIIQVAARGMAQELYLQIQDDQLSFSDLARRYSLGREASSGGVLGPVLAANLRPALLGVIESLPLAALTEPFFMDDQWVLLRLDERRTPLMDDTMRRLLLDDHSRRWLLEQARERIATYLRRAAG
jgi:parvulin-like peptidyl-prolyl isomerase